MFLRPIFINLKILVIFVVTSGKWDLMDVIFGVGYCKYTLIHFLDLRHKK
jgi:hypothetical protein